MKKDTPGFRVPQINTVNERPSAFLAWLIVGSPQSRFLAGLIINPSGCCLYHLLISYILLNFGRVNAHHYRVMYKTSVYTHVLHPRLHPSPLEPGCHGEVVGFRELRCNSQFLGLLSMATGEHRQETCWKRMTDSLALTWNILESWNIVCQDHPKEKQNRSWHIYLSIHPSTHPSIRLSVYEFMNIWIYLSIYLILSNPI